MNRRFNFEVDRRYRQANKDALVAFLYWVVYLVLASVVALGLGLNKPAEDIDFILAFPAWFFYSAGVVLVVLCILPYFLVRFFYRDYSLDAEEPGADGVDKSQGDQR